MKALRFYLFLLSGAVHFQSISASAFMVYTTLPASYTTSSGIDGSTALSGYEAWADQFVPVTSGILSSIEIALAYDNSPDLVEVRLAPDYYDNVYGDLPSTTSLVSGTVTAASQWGYGVTLTMFTPSSPILLTAGAPYWLVVEPYSSSTRDEWYVNNSGVVGPIAGSFNGATWGQNPSAIQHAFQVNAVPEPSSVMLGMIALGGLALLRLRHRTWCPSS